MGATTKLTAAVSKKESLRTTVPRSIVQQLNLTSGDSLDWQLEVSGGELVVVVRPIKGLPSKTEETQNERRNRDFNA
jgi:antitoxin component of MazEF toxin-antitoxin module